MMTGAGTPADRIPILMYHSISPERGPTSIAPDLFTAQMQAIVDAGWNVAPLAAYAGWRLRGETLPQRTLVITFDDAYQNFADTAFPILSQHGFPATVFVPTALSGGIAAWPGAHEPHRAIMAWGTIRKLAAKGIEFAPHSRTHANLAALDSETLQLEIAGSKQDIEDRLGAPARHFAPPYGHTSPAADAMIAANYEISVGVELGIARRTSPQHAAPRLEMLYYSDVRRWKSFLSGTGDAYLFARQCARAARRLLVPSAAAQYS